MRWKTWTQMNLYKLRKWKTPRADLHPPRHPISAKWSERHVLHALMRACHYDRAVFALGDRVSDPCVRHDDWSDRMRRQMRRRRKR